MTSSNSGTRCCLNGSLNIFYQNVRGLRSKTIKFYRNLCVSSYDVVVLTETWLTSSVSDSELFDNRYMVWRRDRNYELTDQSRGGGILIAVRKDIAAHLQPDLISTAEDLWLAIPIQSNDGPRLSLYLCVLYLCKQNLGLSFSAQLTNFLSKLDDIVLNHPDNRYLILGDFNLSGISWQPSEHILLPTNMNTADEYSFVDAMHTHNLCQYNHVTNRYGRTLDLVLSNYSLIVSECKEALVPIDPHHKALLININSLELSYLKPAVRINYKFLKGDYNSVNTEIQIIDWHNEIYKRSTEEAVNYFYTFIRECENVLHTVVTVAAKLGVALEERDIVFAQRVSRAVREVRLGAAEASPAGGGSREPGGRGGARPTYRAAPITARTAR